MSIIDSKTLKPQKEYDNNELKELARKIRAYSIISITAAGSGHTGGVMSVADIATVLYFKISNHDPKAPDWDGRDRVFWSAGHKAPALYAALGLAGYFDLEKTVRLRKLDSGFEGHPNRFKLAGIECSSGSLGQGLGVAVGSALRAFIDSRDYRVFCIMGDGELNEGSVWEAAMSASHHGLDNLVGIIDRNNLQIDGFTKDIMNTEPIIEKWQSFGWEVIEIDGHDFDQIDPAIKKAISMKDKPVCIVANTIKGKGVSFMENQCDWHGKAPSREEREKALSDLTG